MPMTLTRTTRTTDDAGWTSIPRPRRSLFRSPADEQQGTSFDGHLTRNTTHAAPTLGGGHQGGGVRRAVRAKQSTAGMTPAARGRAAGHHGSDDVPATTRDRLAQQAVDSDRRSKEVPQQQQQQQQQQQEGAIAKGEMKMQPVDVIDWRQARAFVVPPSP
ncbi:MAG: hypothetical protein M1815_003187 [Lichina confinis]|nr:MAG: hypothetical protein M1815_003187 [Lichina confinis]